MQDLKLLAQERMEVLVPKEEDISPEGLEIANKYLELGDKNLVAKALALPLDFIAKELNRKEVKRYVDAVYMDKGYRNRDKLSGVLDSVIDKKLEELREADIGSSKDISDLLKLAHEFRMAELEMALKFEKLHQAEKLAMIKENSKVVHNGPTINIQDNSQFGGNNYGALLSQLMEMK
jgi:hypothetical protein